MKNNSEWIACMDSMPNEGQKVLVALHAWSKCTDGRKSFWKDKGVIIIPTFWTKNPYPLEGGFFVNGFLIAYNEFHGTYHRNPRIRYWKPLYETEPPKNA